MRFGANGGTDLLVRSGGCHAGLEEENPQADGEEGHVRGNLHIACGKPENTVLIGSDGKQTLGDFLVSGSVGEGAKEQ